MSDSGIDWRKVLGWFCGEPLSCQPTSTELSRDREYRLPCAIGLLALLAGLLIFIMLQSKVSNGPTLGLLLLSLMPYQVFAFGGCLLALLPMVHREGFEVSYDVPMPRESFSTKLNASLHFLLLIYPVILVLNAISLFFCQKLGIETDVQVIESLGREGGLWYWLFSGVSSVIIAPVVEEVLIRLVLFRCIRSISPLWATFLSSLLFGLMHNQPQYVLSLSFVGLCLQHARALGGLPRSILLHSTYNLVSFLLLFIHVKG